ncbi:MAG: hypothetical protein MJZ41_01785 [Bacteroidaceae bacterium]|nr:hypothetical protein [Bacteroidaceae bacterium]
MKNFDYLHDIPELATLYKFCDEAECSHNTNADVCALNCRRALEWLIRAIYAMKQSLAEVETLLASRMDYWFGQ